MDKELLLKTLQKLKEPFSPAKILVGFDGFIDEIVHAVSSRSDPYHYEKIPTISSFSDRIATAAGLSSNIELHPLSKQLGGNGPLMGNALLQSGYDLAYIGALGYPDIHPIFSSFASKCHPVISLADPGHTDAIEFTDGKILLGKTAKLIDVSWENLVNHISLDRLETILNQIKLVAFTNWTMLPNLNTIITNFLKILKKTHNKPYLFIDLADPQKRSDESKLEILEILQTCNQYCPVVLGLNERESDQISKLVNIRNHSILERAIELQKKLQLFGILIHPVKGAAFATYDEAYWVDGPYCSNPAITTGAGDHFNAGFCNGLLQHFTYEEALLYGVCTSGFYVREKHSPSRAEIIEFMKTLPIN